MAKITSVRLRQIIKEELMNVLAEGNDDAPAAASEAKLNDSEKKKLDDLLESKPTNLVGFAKSMREVANIVDGIDAAEANLSSTQITILWNAFANLIKVMKGDDTVSKSQVDRAAKAMA